MTRAEFFYMVLGMVIGLVIERLAEHDNPSWRLAYALALFGIICVLMSYNS